MPEDVHEPLKDEEGIQNGKPATCRPAQTPRGEPSRGRGIVLQFYPMASRRLPGMTQRNAFTQQFCCEGMHALR